MTKDIIFFIAIHYCHHGIWHAAATASAIITLKFQRHCTVCGRRIESFANKMPVCMVLSTHQKPFLSLLCAQTQSFALSTLLRSRASERARALIHSQPNRAKRTNQSEWMEACDSFSLCSGAGCQWINHHMLLLNGMLWSSVYLCQAW